jgi:hypothetical protein
MLIYLIIKSERPLLSALFNFGALPPALAGEEHDPYLVPVTNIRPAPYDTPKAFSPFALKK